MPTTPEITPAGPQLISTKAETLPIEPEITPAEPVLPYTEQGLKNFLTNESLTPQILVEHLRSDQWDEQAQKNQTEVFKMAIHALLENKKFTNSTNSFTSEYILLLSPEEVLITMREKSCYGRYKYALPIFDTICHYFHGKEDEPYTVDGKTLTFHNLYFELHEEYNKAGSEDEDRNKIINDPYLTPEILVNYLKDPRRISGEIKNQNQLFSWVIEELLKSEETKDTRSINDKILESRTSHVPKRNKIQFAANYLNWLSDEELLSSIIREPDFPDRIWSIFLERFKGREDHIFSVSDYNVTFRSLCLSRGVNAKKIAEIFKQAPTISQPVINQRLGFTKRTYLLHAIDHNLQNFELIKQLLIQGADITLPPTSYNWDSRSWDINKSGSCFSVFNNKRLSVEEFAAVINIVLLFINHIGPKDITQKISDFSSSMTKLLKHMASYPDRKVHIEFIQKLTDLEVKFDFTQIDWSNFFANSTTFELFDLLYKHYSEALQQINKPNCLLHIAIEQENLKLVMHLLELGFDPNHEDETGKNAMQYTASCDVDDTRFYLALEQHGATFGAHNYLLPSSYFCDSFASSATALAVKKKEEEYLEAQKQETRQEADETSSQVSEQLATALEILTNQSITLSEIRDELTQTKQDNADLKSNLSSLEALVKAQTLQLNEQAQRLARIETALTARQGGQHNTAAAGHSTFFKNGS